VTFADEPGEASDVGVEAVENEDGTFDLLGVPVFLAHTRVIGEEFDEETGEVRPVAKTFDTDWLASAVERDAKPRRPNYVAPLHVGHHDDMQAWRPERVGGFRLSEVRPIEYDGERVDALFADLLGLDPWVYSSIRRGALPYVSVEVLRPDGPPEINSIALLDSEVPFFRFDNLDAAIVSERLLTLPDETPIACRATGETIFRAPIGPALCYRAGAGREALLFRFDGEKTMAKRNTKRPTAGRGKGRSSRQRGAAPRSRRPAVHFLDDTDAALRYDDDEEGDGDSGGGDVLQEARKQIVEEVFSALGGALDEMKSKLFGDDGDDDAENFEDDDEDKMDSSVGDEPGDHIPAVRASDKRQTRRAPDAGDLDVPVAFQAKLDALEDRLERQSQREAKRAAAAERDDVIAWAVDELAEFGDWSSPARRAKLAKLYKTGGREGVEGYVESYAELGVPVPTSEPIRSAYSLRDADDDDEVADDPKTPARGRFPKAVLAYRAHGPQKLEAAKRLYRTWQSRPSGFADQKLDRFLATNLPVPAIDEE
jgi:hypothetical protein